MESGGPSPLPSFPVSRTSTPSGSSNLNPHAARRTTICVYCGSSPGHDPAHMEAARALGRVMAANNISLVYGGGTFGLMGEVAKTLVSLSGPDAVHGIIPEALVKYERDPSRTASGSGGSDKEAPLVLPKEEIFGRTTVVKDMHTRKQMMAQEVIQGGPGSGFVALSGGYGTMEELLETATWNQLGIHTKGICVLNINGYYDGLLQWINKSAKEGFIRGGNADVIGEAKTAEDAIRVLKEYKNSASSLKLEWGNE